MADIEFQPDGGPDFAVPWLQRWISEDFSWFGLSNQRAWVKPKAGSLQDYFRKLEHDATDEELIGRGIIIDCGEHGFYHILFVPDEWATSSVVPISGEELTQKKQRYWNKVITDGGIREHFRGIITGVHLSPDDEERLVLAYHVSFEWIRFKSSLRNIPRRGDRSFTNCCFDESVDFYGAVNTEGGSSQVHFTWCEFKSEITVTEVSNLALLDFNGSLLRKSVLISDSLLKTVRFDYCYIQYLSFDDSEFSGKITLGASHLVTTEWMNCTFEAHVLFVDVKVIQAINLPACDFKARVTFASMVWPTSPYLAASASGSKFDGIVAFEGGAPPPVQLFQDADFKSRVAFDGYSDQLRRASFHAELSAVESQKLQLWDPKKHAEDIEAGCRTLRKIAEAAGDVQSEHLWHRSELIARRARGESAIAEKGFSHLYGLLADYGLSISRPFLALAASTLLFALLYAWLGGASWTGPIHGPSLGEGLGYSLNRTLPIGVFVDDSDTWRKELLGSGGQLGSIAIRIVATLQTVLSAILIYLGVMAVRRKFRIS